MSKVSKCCKLQEIYRDLNTRQRRVYVRRRLRLRSTTLHPWKCRSTTGHPLNLSVSSSNDPVTAVMATGRMAKRIKFPPWWFVEILGVTTKLESIVNGRTTNKNNVLRKLIRKWSGPLHDYVRRSVRLKELRARKNWMAIATLVQSFPIKEREWRRKGAKKKKQERQGWGSERVQRHAFPRRGRGKEQCRDGG